MQAILPHALRLARSVALSGAAAVAVGVTAEQAQAAPPVNSAVVSNGTLLITDDNAGHTLTLVLDSVNPTLLHVITDTNDAQDFDRSQFTQIIVTAGRGDDTIRIGTGFADELVTVDGGGGNDTIVGGDGNDVLFGGGGNDVVTGGRGADVAVLGKGADSFVWNPGDGSDTVDGQRGSDTMVFNGANIGEHMVLSANGTQTVLTRDVGTITMNMSSINALDLKTLGGADVVDVGDLTATDLTDVDLGLGASDGSADGQADQVTLSGTPGNDNIKVGVDASVATVRGLHPALRLSGADAQLDHLQINALGGNDKSSSKGDVSAVIQVAIDLGAE